MNTLQIYILKEFENLEEIPRHIWLRKLNQENINHIKHSQQHSDLSSNQSLFMEKSSVMDNLMSSTKYLRKT